MEGERGDEWTVRERGKEKEPWWEKDGERGRESERASGRAKERW